MTDFLSMGGYAAYVWPSFGFVACVLLGLLGQSWWVARRREAEFDRLRAAAATAGRTPGPAAAGAGPPPVRRRAAVRVRTATAAAAEAPGGTEPAATARD